MKEHQMKLLPGLTYRSSEMEIIHACVTQEISVHTEKTGLFSVSLSVLYRRNCCNQPLQYLRQIFPKDHTIPKGDSNISQEEQERKKIGKKSKEKEKTVPLELLVWISNYRKGHCIYFWDTYSSGKGIAQQTLSLYSVIQARVGMSECLARTGELRKEERSISVAGC